MNVKRGMLCLLLLSGCWSSEGPRVEEYAVTWTCLSSGGCERAEEVERIDRMVTRGGTDAQFTSTLDSTFAADATVVFSNVLPYDCGWLYFLSLFGHELERSSICIGAASFQLELSIPNQDPATYSMWLVRGLHADLF
jgi:hypothetical protein